MSATRTIDDNDSWTFNNMVVLGGGVTYPGIPDKSNEIYQDVVLSQTANTLYSNVLVNNVDGTLNKEVRYGKQPLLRLGVGSSTYPSNSSTLISWNGVSNFLTHAAWPYTPFVPPSTSIPQTILFGPVTFRVTIVWSSSVAVTAVGTHILLSRANNTGSMLPSARIPWVLGMSDGSGTVCFETGSISTNMQLTVVNTMLGTDITNFIARLYVELM